MATIIKIAVEDLPEDAVEIGVSWQNSFEGDPMIREALESEETVYVVREDHYNEDGSFDQWSKAYFYA